ncbi:FCD domain-containing protein [Fulvimarina sp. MAC8]|uniref:FadR/GntR family transcriptional regulator n=1 Tax=Fulvimarina sp. MAC8 TaxID=3162874 RepID=UPI0032EB9E77
MQSSSEGTLLPIERRHLSGEVARQILQLIATRSLRSGDRLPTERELASTLQVSRSAVREGLKYLSGLHIVDIRQGSGTFVKKSQNLALLDPSLVASEERRSMLAQATVARRAIDCLAAELAATKPAAQEIAELRSYLERADSEPFRTELSHSIDLTFEAILGRMTGNPYVIALQEEAHRYFRSAWETIGLMPRPADERSEQHWQIFAAIEKATPEEAGRLMKLHFEMQALKD